MYCEIPLNPQIPFIHARVSCLEGFHCTYIFSCCTYLNYSNFPSALTVPPNQQKTKQYDSFVLKVQSMECLPRWVLLSMIPPCPFSYTHSPKFTCQRHPKKLFQMTCKSYCLKPSLFSYKTVCLIKVILCASEHICSIVRYCFRSFKQL